MRPVDLLGALILAGVVPSLLTTWASVRVASTWGILFATVSLCGIFGLAGLSERAQRIRHRIWITALAVLWASLPLIVWSDLAAAITAITVLCLIVLSVHALNLSLSADDMWYVPSLAMGASVSVSAVAVGSWSHALMIAVFSLFVIAGGTNSDSVFRRQVRSTVVARFLRDRYEHQATHDALTGLPNRRAAEAWMEAAAGREVTVAAIDFDDFKRINERWGHLVGDEALVTVASHLQASLEGWTVARMGGDEFRACALGRRSIDELGPFDVQSDAGGPATSFEVGVSCGVATGTATEQDLAAQAEYALARAKKGKGQVTQMSVSMRGAFEREQQLSHDFDAALDDGAVSACWQKVWSALDGSVAGAEVDARWNHPTAGPLAAADFAQTISASGLSSDLAHLLIDQAVLVLSEVKVDLLPWALVTIRGSAAEHPDLPDRVFTALERLDVDPARLCIDVGTVWSDDDDRLAANAARLHDIGVRVAMHDFGAGRFPTRATSHGSAIYRLSPQLVADPVSMSLVRAAVAFAGETGATIMAEGVADQGAADRMRRAAVNVVAGEWFGDRLPSDALIAELNEPATDPLAERLCS